LYVLHETAYLTNSPNTQAAACDFRISERYQCMYKMASKYAARYGTGGFHHVIHTTSLIVPPRYHRIPCARVLLFERFLPPNIQCGIPIKLAPSSNRRRPAIDLNSDYGSLALSCARRISVCLHRTLSQPGLAVHSFMPKDDAPPS